MNTSTHDGLPESPAPPASLQAFIQQDLAALARRRRLRLALFAAFGLGLALGAGWGASHRSPANGTLAHWAVLVGFGVCGLCLSAMAFGLSLPSGRRLRPLVGLGVASGLVLLALMISDNPAHGAPLSHGVGCLMTGAGVAVALLLLAVGLGRNVLRRHAPTGLLLGVGVGLIGLIPLHIGCPVLSAGHLLLWHGLVPVVSGALAGVLWSMLEPA